MNPSEGLEQQSEPAEPFPKADVVHRFVAKFIDFLIAAALAKLLPPVGFFAGATYLFIADGLFQGQSVGKRLIGLETVRPDTGAAISYRESILRNSPFAAAYFCLVIPYLGWILAGAVVMVETLLVIGNLRGHRVGDEIAKTMVIDRRSSTQESVPINR